MICVCVHLGMNMYVNMHMGMLYFSLVYAAVNFDNTVGILSIIPFITIVEFNLFLLIQSCF